MLQSRFTYTVAALFGAANTALADNDGPWADGYSHMMWGTGYGMIGGFMMILFWAAIIGLVVLVVRWIGGNGGNRPASTAKHILQEPFARGEIDEDEYRRRRTALEE